MNTPFAQPYSHQFRPRAESLSILYLGADSGTSRHRAFSLRRLGHAVRILDPYRFLPQGGLANYWNHHTGALGFGNTVRVSVLQAIRSSKFDLVWVDGGVSVSPELVRELKRHARFIVNYNIDDPFGSRDSNKWRLYLRSIALYDLVVVVRDCNVNEAFEHGARDVMRVHMSSDEVAHSPRRLSPGDPTMWGSEVAFIGTWMPERGPFLARLVQLGVPLNIWGDRWRKATEWPVLKSHWRGSGLYQDDDYARAVQCAKVCIGLLSKGNRDLCTTRSFEIPRLGSVLCAERTSEHLALYKENVEAVFWSDAEECAERCRRLLDDSGWRSRLARNGQKRANENPTSNETTMSLILSRVYGTVAAEELISR